MRRFWKVLKAAGKGAWGLMKNPAVQAVFVDFVTSKLEQADGKKRPR